MESHILLRTAFYFEPCAKLIQNHSDFIYDNVNGYWENKYTGELLSMSREIEALMTKKADIETGEDQKGE